MARRLVGYAEDLSESTSTTTTVATKAQVTANLVNGTTYLLVWSYLGGADDTSSVLRATLRDTTASSTVAVFRHVSRDATDYVFQGGAAYYTAAATASRSFAVSYARESGAGTVKIKGVRLLLVELGANDKFAANTANQTTASAALVDALALTFTPPSSGDYLLIASAAVGNSATEIEMQTPGGASVNNCNASLVGNTSYVAWGAIWKETLAASSQTLRIRWRSTSGGTQNLDDSFLIAVRLDDAYASQSTQDDTGDGGTDTSYVTSETLNGTGLTPASRDTVVLMGATLADSSSSESSYLELREDATVLTESIHEGHATATRTSISGLFGYLTTTNAASISWTVRRKSEGVNTTTVEYAAMAVIGLNGTFAQAASATLPMSGTIRKSVEKRLAATLTMTATLLARVLFTCALVAGMAMTASMRREVHKGLSATLTATGTIVKIVHKALSAACTLTGSIAKAFPVHLVASLTATASMTRTIYKFLSGSLPMTGVLGKIKAVVVNMSASLGMTAAMRASTLFIRSLSASITLSATVQRTISKMLSAPLPVIARPIAWVASMFAATRHDKPNWNQCARCWRKQRPNKMHQQMEYRGPRLVWTGLYVCHSCLDDPQPQEIWPRDTGGDPKPVILARPRRD